MLRIPEIDFVLIAGRNALRRRDRATGGHARRVCALTVVV
jgi:hypothetical protein